MFFGSGNLIFPLILGARYEAYFVVAAFGFVITAVALPTLGILAMIPAHGNYERLFDKLIPFRYAQWFIFAALLFWIPLGSGPRCVVLAHASISTYLSSPPPIWLFSLIFLILVYFCVLNRSKIIDILGKFLTPALLVAIGCIVVSSLLVGGNLDIPEQYPLDIFINSVVDGYYTQDLIAAIFFSSALVSMIHQQTGNMKTAMKKTFQGGIIAVLLLALLYAALMAASAIHGDQLRGLSGERLVSELALITLGPTFGSISSMAVSLACFTTEIALVLVFADFLAKYQKDKNKTNNRALLITLTIIFLMSLVPFEGIMAVVAPAMQIIYPILFLLVVRFLIRTRTSVGH
jgi:LIVCS family branched-chain amino acid:cation transporter